jgi:phage/plasmid-associated DNA primase
MNEIRRDIKEEHIDEIKAFLYQNFKQEIMRKAVAGFPEWYKKRLVEENFNEENTTD